MCSTQGPPADGLEYLRRVRWEAAQCPSVTRAEIDPRLFDRCARAACAAKARRRLFYAAVQQALTRAPANGAANARATRQGLLTLLRRRLGRRCAPCASGLCAAGTLTCCLRALQASKAWVEAFQPEFASLRAVRAPCLSLACLCVAVYPSLRCTCVAARSRCAARSSARKQTQACCKLRCLRFATAPPGRCTAWARARGACVPERRTKMQARAAEQPALPVLNAYASTASHRRSGCRRKSRRWRWVAAWKPSNAGRFGRHGRGPLSIAAATCARLCVPF